MQKNKILKGTQIHIRTGQNFYQRIQRQELERQIDLERIRKKRVGT